MYLAQNLETALQTCQLTAALQLHSVGQTFVHQAAPQRVLEPTGHTVVHQTAAAELPQHRPPMHPAAMYFAYGHWPEQWCCQPFSNNITFNDCGDFCTHCADLADWHNLR